MNLNLLTLAASITSYGSKLQKFITCFVKRYFILSGLNCFHWGYPSFSVMVFGEQQLLFIFFYHPNDFVDLSYHPSQLFPPEIRAPDLAPGL